MNWGKAKFEVLTLRKEIMDGLLRGENLSEIHRSLTEQGKIKTAKSTFLLHTKDLREQATELLTSQYSKSIPTQENRVLSTQNNDSKLRKMPDWDAKSDDEDEDNGSW